MAHPWQTGLVPEHCDALAPDGSEIRLLVQVAGGSMVHCTLPPGAVTRAVYHRTVEEAWYVVGGAGRVWRKAGPLEEIVELRPGTALTIPLGASFQFRADGPDPLTIVIATMPPWPGPDEAVPTAGPWPATV